jgi:DNA-binding GntR family transcriptional regulator
MGASMPAKTEDTLKDKIYTELRQSIIMGHRPAGQKIDIKQISRRYNSSVTPVREALQMLNQEGLVTIKAHSGYLVAQFTLKQLRDLLGLREILETACIELAAERITDDELDALKNVYIGYTGDDDESYARYTAENRQFHYLIAQATGNQELADLLGSLHDRLARFMVMRRAGKEMQQSHTRILEALQRRDVAAARQSMRDEVTDSHEKILDKVIREQGDLWPLGQ